MASRDAEIWAAVRDFLLAYPDLPADVVQPGDSFDAVDPLVPYLILDDVRFDPLRRYFTGANWRTGSLMIMVMVPLQWTYAQRVEYAGRIADYFEQDSVMSFGSVALHVARKPTVDGAGFRDGSHFRMPLNIQWEGEVV